MFVPDVSTDEEAVLVVVLLPRWCSGIRCILTSATIGKSVFSIVLVVLVLLPTIFGLAVLVESCSKKADDDTTNNEYIARRKRQDPVAIRENMNAGTMCMLLQDLELWDRVFIIVDVLDIIVLTAVFVDGMV